MTYRSIWTGAALVLHLGVGVSLHAASNAQAVQPPDSVDPAVASPVAPEPSELYSYDSEGRRDPFVSLIARGVELPSVSERPDGLLGFSINEVALRGVVLSLGTYLAVLEAPDNKTYIVRPDDLLFNGSVKEITAEFIVFMEDVIDPLSLVTEREVRKGLRDAEEGR